MPLSFCSITCVTVVATVSAEAPGYVAVICTETGATLGYCSTGSVPMEAPPIIMMTMAITHARIGRLIKKPAMSVSL
ncbi:hypothetical protein R69746_05488 [Paraburkholderia aspalathi]|nr:hypothetical protein R69746_05488 [Paraburkholderia aspalathi]